MQILVCDFLLAGNGLDSTITKYCYFNVTLMCSAMGEILLYASPKISHDLHVIVICTSWHCKSMKMLRRFFKV